MQGIIHAGSSHLCVCAESVLALAAYIAHNARFDGLALGSLCHIPFAPLLFINNR